MAELCAIAWINSPSQLDQCTARVTRIAVSRSCTRRVTWSGGEEEERLLAAMNTPCRHGCIGFASWHSLGRTGSPRVCVFLRATRDSPTAVTRCVCEAFEGPCRNISFTQTQIKYKDEKRICDNN